MRNITYFVQIAKVKEVKLEVYTNEQGKHNKAHLHASTSRASMSTAIEDSEVLACSGKISHLKLRAFKNELEIIKT